MDESAEYIEIMKDIMFCMRFVERTEIYKKLYNSLRDDRLLGKKIKEIVNRSPGKMKLVIYNLGSIQFTWPSKFRLSLCLLLRKTLRTIFDQIHISDPTINCCELNVIVNLECSVFLSNDPDYKINGPTMIYMPYADPILFENLLKANWSPLILSQIVVFGSSYLPMMRDLQLKKSTQRIRRLTAIKDFVMQFNMCSELKGVFQDEEIAGRFEKLGENYENHVSDTTPSKWIDYQETLNEHCPMLALHFFNLKQWIRVASSVPNVSSVAEIQSEPFRGRGDDGVCPGDWYLDPQKLVLERRDELEVPRMREELVTTMEEIRESEAYKRFYFVMKNDPAVIMHISRIIDSTKMLINLVIYQLGSLEVMYSSQYDLAIALLLKKDSIFPIAEIEVFNPSMTPVDIKVYSDFNIRILSVNERCRRMIEMPTIFFCPRLHYWLVGNIFQSNFSDFRLNQMIFVGADTKESVMELVYERLRYIWAVERYRNKQVYMSISPPSSSIEITGLKFNFYHVEDNNFKRLLPHYSPADCFFYDYIFDSFHQEGLLLIDNVRITHEAYYNPRIEEKSMLLRRPVSYMKRWRLPNEGFVKLNFHGYVDKGRGMAGFGGTFHAEKGELLLSYAGPLNLDTTDLNMASLKSLKEGLKQVEEFSLLQSRKLEVEGDDLSVLRWTSRLFPPPERVSNVVGEIEDMVDTIATIGSCCFFHLYREANCMAIDLANRGANLPHLCTW